MQFWGESRVVPVRVKTWFSSAASSRQCSLSSCPLSNPELNKPFVWGRSAGIESDRINIYEHQSFSFEAEILLHLSCGISSLSPLQKSYLLWHIFCPRFRKCCQNQKDCPNSRLFRNWLSTPWKAEGSWFWSVSIMPRLQTLYNYTIVK